MRHSQGFPKALLANSGCKFPSSFQRSSVSVRNSVSERDRIVKDRTNWLKSSTNSRRSKGLQEGHFFQRLWAPLKLFPLNFIMGLNSMQLSCKGIVFQSCKEVR